MLRKLYARQFTLFIGTLKYLGDLGIVSPIFLSRPPTHRPYIYVLISIYQYISICLYYPSIHPSSVCLVRLVCLTVCLSVCLSVCLAGWLAGCLSVAASLSLS